MVSGEDKVNLLDRELSIDPVDLVDLSSNAKVNVKVKVNILDKAKIKDKAGGTIVEGGSKVLGPLQRSKTV